MSAEKQAKMTQRLGAVVEILIEEICIKDLNNYGC